MPVPSILERVAAASFTSSAILTCLTANALFADLSSHLIFAELHLRLLQMILILSTMMGLAMAWLLPRWSLYSLGGTFAAILLIRQLYSVVHPSEQWSRLFLVLVVGYTGLSALIALRVTTAWLASREGR